MEKEHNTQPKASGEILTLLQLCHNHGYIIDDNNRDAVNKISEYLTSNETKGLLLLGYYGTGKTWLMKLVNELTPIRLRSTERIINDTIANAGIPTHYTKQNYIYEYNGTVGTETEYPFCFDELGGQNDRKLNIWGNEIYPMSVILKAHYEKNIKCHAITNYSSEDLVKLYGGEVIDRFKEMFLFVKFKGGSRRK